jgi:hypothetical protein
MSEACGSIDAMFAIWDYIILEDDPATCYYIALAIVESLQEVLVALTAPSDIANALQEFRIATRAEAVQLCKQAKLFKGQTPNSFAKKVVACALKVKDFDSAEYDELKNAICLSISPAEVLRYQVCIALQT